MNFLKWILARAIGFTVKCADEDSQKRRQCTQKRGGQKGAWPSLRVFQAQIVDRNAKIEVKQFGDGNDKEVATILRMLLYCPAPAN
jgi:hypothetical protein